MSRKKKKKGWHQNQDAAPHRGAGTATVEPIRKRKDINAVKESLKDNLRDYALFVLGINTGFRASDLLSLKFKDILSPDKHIVKKLKVVEHKTNKCRHIRLGDNPRLALQRLYLDAVDDLNPDDGDVGPRPDDYIFQSRKGGRLTVQRLHQLINEWLPAAGLDGHWGTHTLRKTYGCQLYKRGTALPILMRVFGHSSQSITLRYIGVEQDQIDEANLRLNL